MDLSTVQTTNPALKLPAVQSNSVEMPVVNCRLEMELSSYKSEKENFSSYKIKYLDTVNSYLLVDELSGRLSILGANFEAEPKFVCEYSRPVKVAYNSHFGSLVIADRTHIGFRREHNWLYSLATLLDPPASTSVRLEISFDEGKDWINYFNSPDASNKIKLEKTPFLCKFAEDVENSGEEMGQMYSIVLEVGDGRRLLSELTETFPSFAQLSAEMREEVYGILPSAFGLMERLRLQLYPKRPYSQGLTGQKVTQVKRSLLNSEAARRATFFKWPHNDYKFALPETMAEAGFFHQPNEASSDRVLCFTCNVCLVSWELNDDPYQEHERHSADCSFINNPSYINVPLSMSMASLAAIPWSADSNTLPSIQNAILGFSTPNCELFAFCAHQQQDKPIIQLLDLSKLTQNPYSLVVDVSDTFLSNSLGLGKEGGCAKARMGNNMEGQNERIRLVEVSAICCAGIAAARSTGAGEDILPRAAAVTILDGDTKVTATLIVGVSIEDSRLKGKSNPNEAVPSSSSEVSALNTFNECLTANINAAASPLIVPLPEEQPHTHARQRPFILVYHVVDSLNTFTTDTLNQEDRKDSKTIVLPQLGNKPESEKSERKRRRVSSACAVLRVSNTVLKQVSEENTQKPEEANQSNEQSASEDTIDQLCDELKQVVNESKALLNQEVVMAESIIHSTPLDVDQSTAYAGYETNAPDMSWYEQGDIDGDGFIINETPNYGSIEKVVNNDYEANLLEVHAAGEDPASVTCTSTDINIYYDQRETSTIVMQCFRLPHELDSTHFRIDHIVSSNCNSGFAIVGVNRVKQNDCALSNSAIVIYSRLEFVNMLQESCLNKFFFNFGQIAQILLLPMDYFFAYRAMHTTYAHTKAGGSLCNSKPATMQSVVLRFSSGTLILVDLYTGKWVHFLKDKYAVDVVMGEGEVITVLCKDGSIHTCQIQQYMSHSQKDEEEEAAISMVCSLPPFIDIEEALKTTFPNHVHMSKVVDHIRAESIALQPLTLKSISQLWQVTRADIPLGSTSSPSLSSQPFHIHSPPQWLDNQHIHQHRAFNKRVDPSKEFEMANSKSYVLVGSEGSVSSQDVLQSYVFALNILPGLSWSHVNISLKYLSSTAGAPDLQVTVWKQKEEQSASSSSNSSPFNHPHIQTLLAQLSEQPQLLHQHCDMIVGPLAVSDYMDGAGEASYLQLSSSQLYCQQRELEKGYTMYLLVQSLNNLSSEQLVMRQTAKLLSVGGGGGGIKRSHGTGLSSLKPFGGRSSFGYNSRYSISSAVDRRMCLPPKLRKSLVQSKSQFKAPFSFSTRDKNTCKSNQPSKSNSRAANKLNPQAEQPKEGEISEGNINSSFQWVEELTISIHKSTSLSGNAKLQRILLLKQPDLHKQILQTAAGLLPKSGTVKEPVSREDVYLAQCQALDLLVWLCSHSTNCNIVANGLIKELVDNQPDRVILLQKVLLNGYVNAPRNIAHKWTIVLFELIRLEDNMDHSATTNKFFLVLLNQFNQLVEELYRVEKAGSLHWLFALIVHAIRTSFTSMPDESLSLAVNKLLKRCVEVLSKVGRQWKQRWEGNQLQDKFVNKYKLAGLPLEQQMFDYPTQVLSIQSHCAVASTSEMHPPFTPFTSSAFGKSNPNQQMPKPHKNIKTGFSPPSVFSQFSMAVGVSPGPHSYNFPPPAIWTNQSPLLNQSSAFSAPPPPMMPVQLAGGNNSSSTNFNPNKMVLYFCNPEGGEGIQHGTSIDGSMFPSNSSFSTPNPYYVPAKAHPLIQSHPPSASSIITYQPASVPQYLPASQGFDDATLSQIIDKASKKKVSSKKHGTIASEAKKNNAAADTNWLPYSTRYNKQKGRPLAGDGLAMTSQASALLCKEYAADEIGWMDMFFSNPPNFFQTQSDTIRKSNFSRAPGSAFNANNLQHDGFTAHGGTVDWYSRYRDGNSQTMSHSFQPNNAIDSNGVRGQRVTLESCSLPGLLEAEPLHYICLYGSDHVKVKNMEFSSNINTSLPTTPPNPNHEGKFKMEEESNSQLAYSMGIDGGDNTKLPLSKTEGNSKLSKVSYSLRQKLQYQQHQLKSSFIPQDLQPHNIEPHSQLSSASTFGQPTTPKTTLFLTPQQQQSSLSSEEACKATEISKSTASLQIKSKLKKCPNLSSKFSINSSLFHSPDVLCLVADRMTAGSRKFVVLDFGAVVLLSDLLVPACEYTTCVQLDSWCVDEQVDVIRLLTNSQIDKKSVALGDMQQPVFARYVKITYVVKQLYEYPCQIPLPAFWGTRFYSMWQAYAAANWQLVSRSGWVEDRDKAREKNLAELLRLSELTGTYYEQSCANLKDCIRDNRPESLIRSVYRECIRFRLELNTITSLIRRLEGDKRVISSITSLNHSWQDCSSDQLRVLASSLLCLFNQTIVVLDMQGLIHQQLVQTPTTGLSAILGLEEAVQHFGYFCKHALLPQLQAQCCAWLFHQGTASSWWPDFFPAVLRKHFNRESKNCVFFLLSYLCNESVRHSQMQGQIMSKLLQSIVDQLKAPEYINSEHVDMEISLLSWTLLLVSSAFDIIISKKPRHDRWLFLTGELDHGTSLYSSHNTTNNPTNMAFNNQPFDSTAHLSSSSSVKSKKQQVKFHPTTSSAFSTSKTLPGKSINYYKKLAEQLEKMKKQNGAQLSDSVAGAETKIEELKSRLKSLQSIHAAFKQSANVFGEANKVANSQTLLNSDFFSAMEQDFSSTPPGEVWNYGDYKYLLAQSQTDSPLTQPPLPLQHKKGVSYLKPTLANQAPIKSSPLIPTFLCNQSQRHHKQLKLPIELCLQVVESLVELLIKRSFQLPLSTQLIALKVMAKVLVHGSYYLIPLNAAIEQNKVKALIAQTLDELEDGQWLQHGLLAMLLDVSEAEFKVVHRNNEAVAEEVASKKQVVEPEIVRDEGGDSASSSIEVEAKRRKEEEDLALSSTSSSAEDSSPALAPATSSQPSLPLTCWQTTGLQLVNDPIQEHDLIFAGLMSGNSLQVGFPFSFANYDVEGINQMCNDQQLDELILLACLPIACSELTDQKEDILSPIMELRRKLLPLLCHKQAKARFQAGQTMSSIFLWFDQLLAKEEKIAVGYSSASEDWFSTVFHQLISSLVEELPELESITTKNSAFAYSPSAHLAHYFYSQLYVDVQLAKKTYEQEVATLNVSDCNEKISSVDLVVHRGLLEMAFERCRMASPSDTKIFGDKEAEVENTILQLDSSQNAVLVAVREGMPVRDAILTFAKLIFVQAFCLSQKTISQQAVWLAAETDKMDLSEDPFQAACSASQTIADCVVSGMALDEATLQAASILAPPAMNYTPSQADKKDILKRIKLQFAVECKLSAENCLMQPLAVAVEALAEGQLGLQAKTEVARAALMNDMLSRCSTQRLTSLSRKLLAPAAVDSSEERKGKRLLTASAGSCVTAVMETFNTLILSLADTSNVAVGFPERLMDLYWQYHASVGALLSSKSSNRRFVLTPKLTMPTLNEKAVCALMTFALNYPLMDELMWSQILKAFNFSLSQCPRLSVCIAEFEAFQPLLECFCGCSLNKFNTFSTDSTFGPAIDRAFGVFLELLLKTPSRILLNKIFDCLSAIFSKDANFGIRKCPLDAIIELTEKLAANITSYLQFCDVEKLANLYALIMNFTKCFMIDFVKKDARTQEHNVSTNLCFECISPNSRGNDPLPSTSSLPSKTSSINAANIASQPLHLVMEFAQEKFKTTKEISDFVKDYQKKAALASQQPQLSKQKAYTGLIEPFFSSTNAGDLISSPLIDEYTNSFSQYRNCSGREPRSSMEKDKNETVICNLLKVISTIMKVKPSLSAQLLQTHHQSIYDALDILFSCRSAITNVEEVSMEYWQVESLADMVLYSLIMTLESGEESGLEAKKFLKLVIYRLRHCHGIRQQHRHSSTKKLMKRNMEEQDEGLKEGFCSPETPSLDSPPTDILFLFEPPLELSSPIAFLLIRCIKELWRKKLFVELGGHIFVAEQLHQSILACTDNWPLQSSFCPLNKQLNAISKHMIGQSPSPSSEQLELMVAQEPNDPTMDNQFNFAPMCSITCSSASAHHLQTLLTKNAQQHRRSRNSQNCWNYHFSGSDQQWIDITLTLPHPIMLGEVLIKPHPSNLTNAPSAVQVELCSNMALSSWSVVRCPMLTLGYNRIRVLISPTFKSPVVAVRIYLKKPPESNNLGLMQIMLLGTSSTQLQSGGQKRKAYKQLSHWLSVFNKLCLVDPPVWNYYPRLPEALTRLFLNRSHQKEVYGVLHTVLRNIDYKSKASNTSVVNLVIDYILNDGKLEASFSLAELLLTLCALPSPHDQLRSVHIGHATAVVRQRQLLQGIAQMLAKCSKIQSSEVSEEEVETWQSMKALAMLMWSASCIVWKNSSEESMRYDTIAMCLDIVTPDMLKSLAMLAAAPPTQTQLSQLSASWLLCSLIKTVPQFMALLLEIYRKEASSDPSIQIHAMTALGRICQSSTAIQYLKTNGLLVEWRDKAVLICNETKPSFSLVTELVSLVSIFESLAVIDSVVLFLDNKEGGEFLKKAMQFVVNQSTNKLVSSSRDNQSCLSTSQKLVKLRDTLINLLRKCICQAGSATKHRSHVAFCLCELFRSEESVLYKQPAKSTSKQTTLPSKKLNPTLLKMIHLVVLEDEKITVRFTDVLSETEQDSGSLQNVEERMMHPMFGCNHNDRIVELPMYTLLSELVSDSAKKTKRIPNELQHQHGSLGGIGYNDLDEDFENFGLLNDWSYGIHGSSSSAYNQYPGSKCPPVASRKDRTLLFSDPFNSAQTQFYCDAYSHNHPLDTEASVASLVEGLQSINRLNHTQGNSFVQKGLNEDKQEETEMRKLSVSQSTSSSYHQPLDTNDGYFTLTLRIKVKTGGEEAIMDKKKEEDILMADFINNAPPVMSTLQHFAREGGLLELAKHLHVYHTFKQMLLSCDKLTSNLTTQTNVLAQNTSTSGFGTPTISKQEQQNSASTAAASDVQFSQLTDSLMAAVSSVYEVMAKQGLEARELGKEEDQEEVGADKAQQEVYDIMKILEAEDQLSSSNAPTTSLALLPTHPPSNTLHIYDDFEMIDYPPYQSELNSSMGNQLQMLYCPNWSDSVDIEFGDFIEQDNLQANIPSVAPFTEGLKTPSYRSRSTSDALNDPTNCQPPPHVLLVLGLFLRLDCYAELFVTIDRSTAKHLLKLALDISSTEKPVADLVAGIKPDSNPSFLTQENSEPISNWSSSLNWSKLKSNISQSKIFSKNLGKRVSETRSSPQQLALFPFVVLQKLFNLSSGNQDMLAQLRKQALDLGIVDVLLICLAHFAHQKAKYEQLREGEEHPDAVGQIIGHVLTATNCMETIKSLCHTTSTPNQTESYANSYAVPVASTSQTAKSTATVTESTSAPPAAKVTNFWAKGTGFGSGSTQQQWNVKEVMARRKQDEENVTCLLNILQAYIEPQVEKANVHFLLPFSNSIHSSKANYSATNQPQQLIPVQFVEILSRSCLSQTLHSYLTNDSVLDISKHVNIFVAVISLVKAICTYDQPDLFVRLFLTPQPEDGGSISKGLMGHNLLNQLSSLNKNISIYLTKLSKQHKMADNKQLTELDEHSGEEEGLAKLLEISKVACEAIQRKVELLDQQKLTESNTDLSTQQMISLSDAVEAHTVTEDIYCSTLKPLQFESIAFFESDGNTLHLPYHYSSSLSAVGQTAGMAKRMRRLAQEVVSLSSSLPLSFSSSVFVCACEERLDAMKVLITGPEGTPYSNGCFEFDVCFPPDFPNSPMLINLETTGNNSVRFNPNLYDDGKVCLSILNTWRGRPEERWNSETSSFLQVIVSIQSLILVNDPYFNEPGYERWRNTPAGQQASREYDANIRNQCVRWAMIEMIRHPPKAFEDVVLKHFWLKRDELVDQVDGWIKETQSHVDSEVDKSKSLPTYLAGLKRQFNFLKEELSKMKTPLGLEHLKSFHFPGNPLPTACPPDKQSAVEEREEEVIDNKQPLIIEMDKEGEITWKLVPLDMAEGEDEASNLAEGMLLEMGLEAQAN